MMSTKSSILLYTAWHCVFYDGYNAYFLQHVLFEFKDKIVMRCNYTAYLQVLEGCVEYFARISYVYPLFLV